MEGIAVFLTIGYLTVKTNRIILAIPPTVIKTLEFRRSKRADDDVLASLRCQPLGRQYIYIQNPPWVINDEQRQNSFGASSHTYPITESDSSICSENDSEKSFTAVSTPNKDEKMSRLAYRASDMMIKCVPSELNCREAYIYNGRDESGVPVGLLMLYFKDDAHFDFWRKSFQAKKLDFIKKKLGIKNGLDDCSDLSANGDIVFTKKELMHSTTSSTFLEDTSKNCKHLKTDLTGKPKILGMKSILWDNNGFRERRFKYFCHI